MTIFTTKGTMTEAVRQFYLDREGMPELVPFGIGPVDRIVGGLGPQSCAILAACTGVGKSSTMLAAMLSSKVPVGCVSVEDGRDVVGTRLLSALSNIDSLKIRRKDLTPSELKTLNKVALTEMDHMFFAYPIAGDIEAVERAVDELCAAGCKMIWLDYLQKIRGHNGDRRNEVSETFTRFQRACARGRAAGVAISQFRRLGDGEKEPQIWHLKESGDLENEARIIILAHRIYDQDGSARIRFRLAKSNYGGEGTRWDMKRDDSGSLREVPFFDQHEEDGW